MWNFDMCRSTNICYSASYSQYSIVDTCRQMELFCRSYGDLSSIFSDRCVFLYVDIRHFSISVELGSVKPSLLYSSYFFDDLCIFFRGFLLFSTLELSDLHPWNLDEYIDTIEYRS